MHDEAFGALGEEGLLRASPWHTDHMHIRFKGEVAGVPEVWKSVHAHPPLKNGKPIPSQKKPASPSKN